MRKNLAIATFLIAMAVGCYLYATQRVREVVILSTNDMHASIDNFSRLATAVRECRDTVDCFLVDAGDRWTGNSYVDLADGRLPIIDLMNAVGYDVVTLGNHEFDMGHSLLQGAIEYSNFPTICANMVSHSDELETLPASVVLKSDSGVKLSFVGIVTNYDHGHPDGDDSRFVGLEFPDPIESATAVAAAAPKAHVRVLLSHIGDDKDIAYAAKGAPFDVIISGHTHNVVDTVVNNTVIGQTGRRLALVGATRIRLRGNKIVEAEYENIDLKGYAEASDIAREVEDIKQNPYLNTRIGSIAGKIDRTGFANMESEVLKRYAKADIGFYHYGGIRIAEFEGGDVSRAMLYDLEPFGSMIMVRDMSLAELQALILEKFNDTGNTKESHRIDLFCTEPYTIYTNAKGDAVSVKFPTLRKGKRYRVAMPDYVSKKYPTLDATSAQTTGLAVLECLIDHTAKNSPIKPDNRPRQRIVKQ